jgi:hypothetical protein
MEIMREGGGISFTVEQTKLATDEELLVGLIARLNRMLCAGESSNFPDRLDFFVVY